MNTSTEIPVTFLGLDRPGAVPGWAKRQYNAQPATIQDFVTRPRGVSVVRTVNPAQIIRKQADYEPLFARLIEDNGMHFRLVFGFEDARQGDPEEIARMLRITPGIASGVELALKKEDLPSSLFEALAKLRSTWEEEDPLSDWKALVRAGRDLRAASGRLDARKIAGVFGIPQSQIARLTGKSRQALSKTPDAPALQRKLAAFEKVARLRALFDDEQFRAWLNTPNDHLENGMTPVEFLKAGGVKQLGDLVGNMLTGSPS
jgi:hypothetical protein